MKETVTIHTMTTIEGKQIRYARVCRSYGHTSVGQSLLLKRLTPHQLRIAKVALIDAKDENWV